MASTDLSRLALDLPPAERLELARRLVESVIAPDALSEAVNEGLRRIDEIATGRVAGLSEEEYRSKVK
jgi:putative addiction module component (TIGR02574 family)